MMTQILTSLQALSSNSASQLAQLKGLEHGTDYQRPDSIESLSSGPRTVHCMWFLVCLQSTFSNRRTTNQRTIRVLLSFRSFDTQEFHLGN